MGAIDTTKKERELRAKWKEKTMLDGKLRNRFVYGAFREEPLLTDKAVVFVATGTDSGFAKKTFDALKEAVGGAEWQLITNNEKLGESLGCSSLQDDFVEPLGRFGTVVALGGLPEYFAKRDGQKVVMVPAGEKDPGKALDLLNAEETAKAEDGRRKVLLIANINNADADECLRTTFCLSSFPDPKEYDVSVLLFETETGPIGLARKEAFPAWIHLVTPKGAPVCTADEYVDIHVIMDMYLPPDEITKKVFEVEADRVLGCHEFDTVICLGEPDKYCYYLSSCLSSGRTIRLEAGIPEMEVQSARLTAGRKRVMEGLRAIEGSLFDEVITEKKVIPFNCSGYEFNEDGLSATKYEGKDYCVLDMVPGSAKERHVQLLPRPAGNGETLIASGDSDAMDTLLAWYAGKEYPQKTLYIYGGTPSAIKASADDLGISDRIVFVSKPDLSVFKYLKGYLELFDAYITANADEYNEVGYLMQNAGKAMLPAGAVSKDISMDSNLTSCRDALLKKLFQNQ